MKGIKKFLALILIVSMVAGLAITVHADPLKVRIEAENFTSNLGVASKYSLDPEDADSMEGITEKFYYLGKINGNRWASYAKVDFGSGYNKMGFRLASNKEGAVIEVRLDSLSGPLVGKFTTSVTSEGYGTFKEFTTALTDAKGVHEVFLFFLRGDASSNYGLCNVDWFELRDPVKPDATPKPTPKPTAKATSTASNAQTTPSSSTGTTDTTTGTSTETSNPETGDNSMFVYIALFILAIAGISVVNRKRAFVK